MKSLSPELLALIDSAKAAPLEDAARLVLADWLEDHRESDRAEFVRIQCRLDALQAAPLARDLSASLYAPTQDRGTAWGPEWHALRDREAELLALHSNEWVGPLADLVNVWFFRRGFLVLPNVVESDLIDRAKEAEAWEGLWPWVECIRLNPDFAKALFRQPLMRHFTGIDLSVLIAPSKPGLRAFFASPHLGCIRHLDLRAQRIGTEEMQALASTPAFAGLVSLGLASTRIKPDSLGVLADAEGMSTLSILDLHDNSALGDAGASALAKWRQVGTLTHLDASVCGIGPAGAKALAGANAISGLRHLALTCNRLKDAGAASLAASPHLSGLSRLDLRDCGVKAPGVEALTASPYLSQLEWLDLSQTSMGPKGASALARSASLASLSHLGLAYCDLGDKGIRELLKGDQPWKLTSLALCGNDLGPSGLQELALTSRLGTLDALDLAHNPSGDEGAHTLASSALLRRLRWLALSRTGLSLAGAMAVAKAGANLHFLNVANNEIGVEGATMLAEESLPCLTDLDVDGCGFSRPGLDALVRGKGLNGLRRVFLDFVDTHGREKDFIALRAAASRQS